MKEETQNSGIDPELEARIVALVLGEASDFECDQLNRLLAEQPALAKFKESIQRTHGLLCDVATGEAVSGDDDWKLSAGKRDAVLAAFDGETTFCGEDEQPPPQQVVKMSDATRKSVKQVPFWNASKIAAILFVAGLFGIVAIPAILMIRQFRSARTDAETAFISNAVGQAGRREDHRARTDAETAFISNGLESIRSRLVLGDIVTSSHDRALKSDAAAVEFEGETKSKTALSGIRDMLDRSPPPASPYYINDDVQYFDHTESKPRRETDKKGSYYERIANGGDSAYSQAAPRRTGYDDLYFPKVENGRGERTAVEPGAPANSPIRATNGGTALLGGNKRSISGAEPGVSGPGRGEISGESMALLPATPDDSDADHYGSGGEYKSALGGESAGQGGSSSFGYATPGAPSATYSNATDASSQPPQQMGSPSLRYSVELPDAPPVVNEAAIDAIAGDNLNWKKDGKMGGYGGGGSFGRDATDGYSLDVADGVLAADSDTKFPPAKQTDEFSRRAGRTAVDSAERSSPTPGGNNGEPAIEEGEALVGSSAPESGLAGPDEHNQLLRQSGRSVTNGTGHWESEIPPMTEDDFDSFRTEPIKKTAVPAGLQEEQAEDEAFSTFSLHVSDVSFKLAQAALASGRWPEPEKIRIEEFVNAFDYGDPLPSHSERISCRMEQAIHPFLQQRNLLRVSMRTAAVGRSKNTPLRLTLLLDNSGSMERIDRRQTVRRAFALLAQQLTSIDQVTLIGFARQPRLLADKVSGTQSLRLVQLVENLPSEGGTNIEAALQLAFEKAREQQDDSAQNRIILLTDGAVNLGDADPERLSQMIAKMREAGIAFDAAGISAEGLNDEVLEALTRKGDGRYYLLDSREAADDGFARQIAGALRPSAKNVKVQVEFNPKRVGRYKLLGFEKHRLKKEDFRNDTVDAAEMAAAEAGVAVYQFEAKPDGEGDVGSLWVRFFDVSTGQMVENCWPIPYDANTPRLASAAPSMRIATSAALFAAKLRGEPLGETVDLKTLSNVVSGLPEQTRTAKRVGQLQLMIGQARQLVGE